ncbi:MAG TPA: hypothetical protein OIL76_08820 [Veillonellaceae bacterium]|nr:hypothetical protein [Veillonellaceae bacterium]
MNMDIFWGLFIPFLGTSLGAACVFFMRGEMHRGVQRGLTGFASGVMVAASIWSLLIPAIEESSEAFFFFCSWIISFPIFIWGRKRQKGPGVIWPAPPCWYWQ